MNVRNLLGGLAVVATLACGLSGCVATYDDQIIKGQAIGLNVDPKTGITGGSVALSGIIAPKAYKNGSNVTVFEATGPCGETDTPDVASNLNSNASASATTTNGQAIAFATGDEALVGLGARYWGLGGGQAPSPAAIAAFRTCSGAADPLKDAPLPSGSVTTATSAANGVTSSTKQ